MKNIELKNKSGISLLIVVFVISAIALLLATTAGIIGIDELQTGMRQNATLETFAGADGCMETAIKKLRNDMSYTGEALTIGNVACTITVTGSGTSRVIKARAAYTSTNYVRELQANVDWSSQYQITSWQELTN